MFDVDRICENLPGGEILTTGLQDLKCHRISVCALLTAIASPRLRQLGFEFEVPSLYSKPEHQLYGLLHAENPRTAHSRYNAWIRKLVSLEHALVSARL